MRLIQKICLVTILSINHLESLNDTNQKKEAKNSQVKTLKAQRHSNTQLWKQEILSMNTSDQWAPPVVPAPVNIPQILPTPRSHMLNILNRTYNNK